MSMFIRLTLIDLLLVLYYLLNLKHKYSVWSLSKSPTLKQDEKLNLIVCLF